MKSDLLEVCKLYKRSKELKLGKHKTTALIIEKKEEGEETE